MTCNEEHEDWPIEPCAKYHLIRILRGLRRAAIAGLVLPRAWTKTVIVNDPYPLSMGDDALLLPLDEVQKCVQDTRANPRLLKNLDALLTRASVVAAFEAVEEYLGNTRNQNLRPADKEVYEKDPLGKLGREFRDILSHSASSTQFPVKADHKFDWLTLNKGERVVNIEAGSLISFLTNLHNFCETKFSDPK